MNCCCPLKAALDVSNQEHTDTSKLLKEEGGGFSACDGKSQRVAESELEDCIIDWPNSAQKVNQQLFTDSRFPEKCANTAFLHEDDGDPSEVTQFSLQTLLQRTRKSMCNRKQRKPPKKEAHHIVSEGDEPRLSVRLCLSLSVSACLSVCLSGSRRL